MKSSLVRWAALSVVLTLPQGVRASGSGAALSSLRSLAESAGVAPSGTVVPPPVVGVVLPRPAAAIGPRWSIEQGLKDLTGVEQRIVRMMENLESLNYRVTRLQITRDSKIPGYPFVLFLEYGAQEGFESQPLINYDGPKLYRTSEEATAVSWYWINKIFQDGGVVVFMRVLQQADGYRIDGTYGYPLKRAQRPSGRGRA